MNWWWWRWPVLWWYYARRGRLMWGALEWATLLYHDGCFSKNLWPKSQKSFIKVIGCWQSWLDLSSLFRQSVKGVRREFIPQTRMFSSSFSCLECNQSQESSCFIHHSEESSINDLLTVTVMQTSVKRLAWISHDSDKNIQRLILWQNDNRRNEMSKIQD